MLRGLAKFLKSGTRLLRQLNLGDAAPEHLRSVVVAASDLSGRLTGAGKETETPPEIPWLRSVKVDVDTLTITLDRNDLLGALTHGSLSESAASEPESIEILVFVQLRRRGVEAKLILMDEADAPRTPDQSLIALLAQARQWMEALRCGTASSVTHLAERHGADRGDVGRILGLAYLAPDIVGAILQGRQPVELTVSRLKRLGRVPPKWVDQRRLLGFA